MVNRIAEQRCGLQPNQSYLAEIISVKLVFYYLQHNNKSLWSDHNLPGAELDLSEGDKLVLVPNLMGSVESIDIYGAHNKYYVDKHSLLWKPCDFCHLNTVEEIEIGILQDK